MSVKNYAPYQAVSPVTQASVAIFLNCTSNDETFQIVQKDAWFIVGEIARSVFDRAYGLVRDSFSRLDHAVSSFSPFLGAEAATYSSGQYLFEEAKQFYINGQYAVSLEKFNEILRYRDTMSRKNTIAVLNHRAVVYRAIGKVRLALADHLEAARLEKISFLTPVTESTPLYSYQFLEVSNDHQERKKSLDEYILQRIEMVDHKKIGFGFDAKYYLDHYFSELLSSNWGKMMDNNLASSLKKLQEEKPVMERSGLAEHFLAYCKRHWHASWEL